MRDYLGDLVIRIVPYRRLYGSRILCVREVFIVCTLYYVGIVLRLGRFYYVIWTFHVLSIYIMFLSHSLFLCVAVYLLSSLTISSLFFFSNCNVNYERERESVRNTCQTISYRQIVFRLPSHIHHTHPIDTTNRGEFVTVKHEYADTVCIRKKMTLR